LEQAFAVKRLFAWQNPHLWKSVVFLEIFKKNIECSLKAYYDKEIRQKFKFFGGGFWYVFLPLAKNPTGWRRPI
jgi:hypothetical protein